MSADNEEAQRRRRRLLILVVLLAVILLGAGIGTVTLFDGDQPGSSPAESGGGTTPDASGGGVQDNSGTTGATGDTNPSDTGADGTDGEQPSVDEDTGTGGTGGDGGDSGPNGDGNDGTGGPDDGGDTDEGGTDNQINVSLATDGEGTLLDVSGIYPGNSGTASITLVNTGERAGQIRLAGTNVTDFEHGLVDPETRVDDSPTDGELSAAVDMRMTFEYPNGTTTTVIGSNATWVSLADLNDSEPAAGSLRPGEELMVRLEWHVSEHVGNKIQTDAVVFDAVFQLRAPET